MPFLRFREYVRRRDEATTWLPIKPIVPGMGKINPFPATQSRLNRIVPPLVKPAVPPKPAVPKVAQSIPKVVPSPVSQYLKAIDRVFETQAE